MADLHSLDLGSLHVSQPRNLHKFFALLIRLVLLGDLRAQLRFDGEDQRRRSDTGVVLGSSIGARKDGVRNIKEDQGFQGSSSL